MLQEFTRKLVGRVNLDHDESERCMEAILAEETPDAVIASFLTALADKGETAPEILGFARVMRRHSCRIQSSFSNLIDTAGTGGGIETFNISTTAAFVIAGAGVPVAKHGNRAVTSRCGSADLLEALGVNIANSPEQAGSCLRECGLAFMFAPVFHPAMKRVAAIRRQLGHRTIFNLLGPLTNPASASFQIVGVYSPELTETVAIALAGLGCRRGWVVHSRDGLDELSPGAPAQVSAVEDGNVRTFEFQPPDCGFSSDPRSALRGGTPNENADRTMTILRGAEKGPAREVVLLNAAAALALAEETDFAAAKARAEESLLSGAALLKLNQLVEFSGGSPRA
jgi:anthranilate phosphoribosyltransferase